MLLIDSSVWIDCLRGLMTPATTLLERDLSLGRPPCTTGIIIQEVLQGLHRDRDAHLLKARLSALQYLAATKASHVSAAALYRKLRSRGVTVPAADALIAAVAIDGRATVLTEDVEHFRALASVSKLRVLELQLAG